MTLALTLALLIGTSLALFGAGGSIVTMPVLVYVLHLDPHRAAGTSLVIVGTVAMLGGLVQWRWIRVRTAAAFGLAGMAGAVPGAWLNHHVPSSAILLGFAATMLAASARMGRPTAASMAPPAGANPIRAIVVGVAVGVATGFFGVGGGFLIVPALTLVLGIPLRPAVATSLVVIAFNCAAGLAGHAAYGGVEWRLGGELTLAALAGTLLALPLSRHLSTQVLQLGFASMLGVLAVVIFVQTMWGLLA